MKSLRKKFRKLLRHPFISSFIARIGQLFLRCIFSTCRIHVTGLEYLTETASKEKCILMFWHNRLTFIAYFLKQYASQFTYASLISKSREGELLTALSDTHVQAKTIRVAHNGKHHALREIIRYLEKEKNVILITPDGPRGPRYEIKPGIILAAKTTSAFIVPLSWSASHFWQFKTWDQLILPKPFSRIDVKLGEPFQVDKKGKQELAAIAKDLEGTLCNLDREACQVAAKCKHSPLNDC